MRKNNLQPNPERRKFQRLNLPLKVRYKIIGRAGTTGEAKCVNIGGGGIRIWVSHPLEVGDKVEITISIPNYTKPITAIGKVIWTGKAGSQFEGGLQFIRIKFRPKFTEFLCEKMIDLSV